MTAFACGHDIGHLRFCCGECAARAGVMVMRGKGPLDPTWFEKKVVDHQKRFSVQSMDYYQEYCALRTLLESVERTNDLALLRSIAQSIRDNFQHRDPVDDS